MSGVESITLLVSEIPVHTHTMNAFTAVPGDNTVPGPNISIAGSTGGNVYATTQNSMAAFQALPAAGGGLPHNNMQPYLTLNFCIALQGIFPARP
jgi:microcystin-dependent protein